MGDWTPLFLTEITLLNYVHYHDRLPEGALSTYSWASICKSMVAKIHAPCSPLLRWVGVNRVITAVLDLTPRIEVMHVVLTKPRMM